ncbi:crossover junction endodeoxyribonuclease RuvC [Thermus thermamylovorans]|uniref:Crossover junction endodeoxyribonuclease RuvC n=1 Tax=Thermus thermamylovorans TaxID=2509362 RepID=A0A4Q9B691_9DEIN|nr:crossover junction endodeoxyribonuclease RuvC [Thermus thermamylovorans]TBH21570.1 crossover junction endodeoxyribonuclease RuvC [Thermus thermamylovorans]
MVVLGVDPGITHLGLGVVAVEGKGTLRARLLHGEVVRTSHREAAQERVGRIHARVKEALLRFQPQALAVEEQYFYRQNELAYKVGWALGAVLVAAFEAGVPVYAYGPMQVKRALAGHGHATKEEVALMVRGMLGLKEPPGPSHLADALAIALTHAFHARLQAAKPL